MLQNGNVRIFRSSYGWGVQRFDGPEGDKVWFTVEQDLLEYEARRIAGLGPRSGHRAMPRNIGMGESICSACGARVVSRANAHGYAVWTHRKQGR